MGPILGPPNAAFADIPATYTPEQIFFVFSRVRRSALSAHRERSPRIFPVHAIEYPGARLRGEGADCGGCFDRVHRVVAGFIFKSRDAEEVQDFLPLFLPLGRFGVGGIADASRRFPDGKGWFTESRTVIEYMGILHPGRFECDIFRS
jgi:hypothetical protein